MSAQLPKLGKDAHKGMMRVICRCADCTLFGSAVCTLFSHFVSMPHCQGECVTCRISFVCRKLCQAWCDSEESDFEVWFPGALKKLDDNQLWDVLRG